MGIRDITRKPSGVPVRFDQTTSGRGILAALTRNAKIGRACNLYGTTPHDLYTEVAEGVIKRRGIPELGETDKDKALARVGWARHHAQPVQGPALAAPWRQLDVDCRFPGRCPR